MSRLRIGVSFPGDLEDRTVRSGTPWGVVSGLRALGVDVVSIAAQPHPRLEQAAGLATAAAAHGPRRPSRARLQRHYSAALLGSRVSELRGRAAAGALRRAGRLDGVVQLGAGYRLDTTVPRVVYDDMTVAQALTYPYANWAALGERDRRFRLDLQREVYRSADACCMTSSWAAASAEHDFGVSTERIAVVGAGSHEASRAVPDRPWAPPRLLFVGLDWERKNGPRVQRAFERLRATHPDARLDVVGGHPPLDTPGVVGHGRLMRSDEGQRGRLRELFDRATCFVMPSRFEPAGVVFTEAAAAGLPSIGGAVGGSLDFIGDGGCVVDPEDDEAVFDAFRRFADPVEAARVGAIARSRAADFTWDAVAGRLLLGLGVADGAVTASFLPRLPAPGSGR